MKVTYHSAKCGGQSHSGNGDIMFLVLSRDLIRPCDQKVM